MPCPFEIPTTPVILSPTILNLVEPPIAASQTNVAAATPNMDESIIVDPSEQLNGLNLSGPIPDSRTKDETIRALQAENDLLKAEVKILSSENRHLIDMEKQSVQAMETLKDKHGKKMEEMNRRISKAKRMDGQLAKIHRLIGDSLGFEPVELKGAELMSARDEVEAKGAKRDAEYEDDEEMDGMGPMKRARLAV